MEKRTAQRLRYAVTLPVRIILAGVWLATVAIARASTRAECILDDAAEKIKSWTAGK